MSSKVGGRQCVTQRCHTLSNLGIGSLSIAVILACIMVLFSLCFASVTTKEGDFQAFAIACFTAVRSWIRHLIGYVISTQVSSEGVQWLGQAAPKFQTFWIQEQKYHSRRFGILVKPTKYANECPDPSSHKNKELSARVQI